MKDKLWAIGWLAFIGGMITATKGFEPRLEFEIFKWWDKLLIVGVFAFTMLLGFLAGKEK